MVRLYLHLYKPRHFYPHFFRPAVCICFGIAWFSRIHYELDFHGPNCWDSDTKSVNWVCL